MEISNRTDLCSENIGVFHANAVQHFLPVTLPGPAAMICRLSAAILSGQHFSPLFF
jgi:hypothetical protein